ncbi:hypothetical protein QVD17_31126 [Tagetes erecta]|uniref:Uncharacterized protein n=1 Tax=Tagetes erecta TaxID=13708 RepID=A0AAD8K958_TARER|nr:hypothetical protein QVD17_31126 [Tagetes erecta]
MKSPETPIDEASFPIKLDKHGFDMMSRMIPKKCWTKHEENEIQIDIPVEDAAGEIKMNVDTNNTFFLRQINTNKLQAHQLPVRANFEKAVFKNGVVSVNIKNFNREDVKVE